MHPAEHRGLRELYATSRQLREHWRTLAGCIESVAPAAAEELRAGSDDARALLGELTGVTAARGLHGRPAAQGVGVRMAGARTALIDPTLEVNQALRLAVLDVQHVVTLLAYLAALAGDDAELEAFLSGWETRLRAHEDAARAAAIELASEPDVAIAQARPGVGGRIGHGLAMAFGTAGEWFDSRSGG